MERKTVTVEIKDADKGEIEAVFATFNQVDHDGDVTLPGAFEDGAEVVISAYGHSSWMGALPVGMGKIKTTETDARLRGQFFLETPGGKEHFAVVKRLGKKQEWSYGFDVKGTGDVDELPEALQRADRVLTKLKVFEVSPVLVGAGVDTRTEMVKTSNQWQMITPDGQTLLWSGTTSTQTPNDPPAKEDKTSPETKRVLANLKQEGFEIQTVIFPKDKWDSVEAAKTWATDHEFAVGAMDETETSWRFRQKDPDDFERIRTICINPNRDAAPEDCRVLAAGGPLKQAETRSDDSDELKELIDKEFRKFQQTRKRLGLSAPDS